MELPIPLPNSDSQPYWNAAREDRLVIQNCNVCGAIQAVPRAMCGRCQSPELSWRDSMGRGRIVSFSEVHRGPTRAFRDHTPFVLALVELEEGWRAMMNVVGNDRMETRIDDQVEIVFEVRGEDGMKLPQAKRRQSK